LVRFPHEIPSEERSVTLYRAAVIGVIVAIGVGIPARADVGDPQIRTDHPWYPGELAVSSFERLFATQAEQYRRVTGVTPKTDEDRALASWFWRNTHFFHAEDGRQDLNGLGFAHADNWTREYWTGLFGFGFALCGTTHAQWSGEMEHLLGHARSRTVGVDGHTSFEVFLTGGPYGEGKWVLLDQDISTVIFDRKGTRLLSIPEIKADLRLTDRKFLPERQRGWLVSGLHPEDAPGVYTRFDSVAYLPGYVGPPPAVHLRRGEVLRRYFQPGLEDGKTFAFWGRNYNRGGLPGPERDLTWVNQPEKMHGSTTGTPPRAGQARFGNAVYTYRPDFTTGDYREGVVDENQRQVTFEFSTPYLIAAIPPNGQSWSIHEKGCTNGLVLHGKATCSVEISVDGGRSWKDCGKFRDGLDLTDHVKARRQYRLRFGCGARDLAGTGLTMITVCQANAAILPRLKEGGTTVRFEASGQAVASTGPAVDQAKAHLVEGALETPEVTLEVRTPRREPVVAVQAAALVASGDPPQPDVIYQIDYSTDGGKTWQSLVKDWRIPRRGEEPGTFWSQSFCYGSKEIAAKDVDKVRVRFRNSGGKPYVRAEASLVYRTKGRDATKVTFDWTDDAGTHRQGHVFAAGQPAEWKINTGQKVQTRWVEFEPTANPGGAERKSSVRPAADEKSQPFDQAIQKYLADQATELERELLPDIKTAADLEKTRASLREVYLYVLGLKPLPEKTPLQATITGRLERPSYIVEKLHFQSRPGLYVTANLYLPKASGKEKFPAILYQCGHYSQMKRDGNKAAADCQEHAIWFATHGYVALVVDTLELGEIAAMHRGTLRHERWWWNSAGYTPAGVECWNALRAIDYLISRPEVDPERIGATGISGGGVGTFWIAAADDRVKAAAPVSGVGDLLFFAGEGGISRHCDCFFFPNRARWNWLNVAALICPRPLMVVNSDNDVYFPMSANERIANRLAHLYARASAGDQLQNVVSVGGHGYRTDVRRAVFGFFNRTLKGDGRRVDDPDATVPPGGGFPINPAELRVFPTDSDLPHDAINTKIDETFVPRARLALPAAKEFEAWRRDLLDRLRAASFAAWPTHPPEGNGPVLGSRPAEGRETTEKGIEVFWRWLPGKESDGVRWLIVLNPGEEAREVPAWARNLVGDGSVLLLCPRGVGPVAWTRNVFPNTIERSFPLLGGTSDSGRVWDVRTVARRHAIDKVRWRAAGQGQAGLVAVYAALYEPAIDEVVAVDPPPSHQPRSAGAAYGPPLMNVLRVLDVPEALGCLAPRRLVLVGATAAAFDRTTELYRIAGAADRLERKAAP
jgi:cephalosporin-C deacetylase-like acetyl esterase